MNVMTIIGRAWTRVLQLSQTKRNLFANIFGNGWSALIQLLVIPIYIHLLGEEAYGLYAFFLTIAGFAQVLDLGFTPTINRTLAQYSVAEDKADEARTLTRTMEVIYIALGIVLGFCIALASPFLANSWLKATKLDNATMQTALLLMALLAMVQWPLTFYQGGVNGLQKQTKLVTLQVLVSTCKHGGGVIVLLLSPNILALLAWLTIATAFQTIVTALLLWKSLPAYPSKPRVNLGALQPVKQFATGAALTSFAGVPLTQAAPILLSRSVSLTEYGFYSIAAVYAGVIAMLYMPIFTAIYPRLTTLVERKDPSVVLHFFRFSGQFMALFLIPIGFAMAGFSKEILFLWQRNATRADAIAPIAALFVIGNVLSGLQHIPYAIQLAHGNTRISLMLGILTGVLQIPVLVWAIHQYGVMGAAGVFIAVNAISLLLYIYLTDRQVISFGLPNWIVQSVLLPMLASGLVFVFADRFVHSLVPILNLAMIALITLVAFAMTALSMNLIRDWTKVRLQRIKLK